MSLLCGTRSRSRKRDSKNDDNEVYGMKLRPSQTDGMPLRRHGDSNYYSSTRTGVHDEQYGVPYDGQYMEHPDHIPDMQRSKRPPVQTIYDRDGTRLGDNSRFSIENNKLAFEGMKQHYVEKIYKLQVEKSGLKTRLAQTAKEKEHMNILVHRRNATLDSINMKMQSIREEEQTLRDENEELRTQLDESKHSFYHSRQNEAFRFQQYRTNTERRIDELMKENNNLKKHFENTTCENQLKEANTKLKTLAEKEQMVRHENASLRAQLSDKEQTLYRSREKATADLKAYEIEKSNLVTSCNNETVNAQHAKINLEARIDELTKENETLKQTIDDQRQRFYKELQDANESNSQRLRCCQLELESSNTKLHKCQEDLKSIQREKAYYTSSQSDIVHLQKVNKQLKSETTELQTTNSQLKADNTQLQTDNSQLQTEIAELRADNSHLKTSTTQFQNENRQLNKVSNQLQTENRQFKTDNHLLQSANNQLNVDYNQLHVENSHLKENTIRLQDENSRLKTDKRQIHNDKTQLEATNIKLQDENNRLKTANRQLENDNNKLKADSIELQRENSQSKVVVTQLQTENSKHNSGTTQLQKNKSQLETDLLRLKKENSELKANNSHLLKENGLLKADNDCIRKELSQLKTDHNDIQKKYNHRETRESDEITTLTRENDELQNKLHQTETLLKQAERESQVTVRKLQEEIRSSKTLYDSKIADLLQDKTDLEESKANLEERNFQMQSYMDNLQRQLERDKNASDSSGNYAAIQQKLRRTEKDLKEAELELEDTKTRLSKCMGDKLTNNNPNIVDLSDMNRPSKLADRYKELYDNQWTDAYEILENTETEEKRIIYILLNVLIETKRFCDEETKVQMEETLKAITHSDKVQMSAIPVGVLKYIKDCRKSSAAHKMKIEFEKYTGQLRKGTFTFSEHALTITEYLQECFEICWLMAIQDPPVVLALLLNHGERFKTDLYSAYTVTGKVVDYSVWPALLLHENGPTLTKGVAQGMKKA